MKNRRFRFVGWLPVALLATAAYGQSTERLRLNLLADKLTSPDDAIRRAAASELGDAGAAALPVAPALVTALKDKDITVRAEVANALLRIGDGAAPAIADALGDRDAGIRAAFVLSKMGNVGLRALVEHIGHADDAARVSALAGIAQLGPATKRAVPTLVELFRADGTVRSGAALALAKLAETNSALVTPAVTVALRDTDASTRLGAIATVNAMGSDGASFAPILIERLADTQAEVQQAARDSLVRLGALALPALRAGLTTPATAPGVVTVLARMGAPAVPALIDAMGSDGTALRQSAAAAVGEIGPPAAAATAALIKALHDADPGVRVAAARALGAVGTNDAATALVAMIDAPVPDVQRTVIESLRRMGPAAVPALLEGLNTANAVGALDVMVTIGRPAVSEIALGLRHRDVPVRVGAADALGRLGHAAIDAMPFLVQTLSDPAPEVRAAGARALGLMAPDSASAVPGLVVLLKDKAKLVRLAAVVALGQMRGSAASVVKAVGDATHDDEPDVRAAAQNARRMIEGR
jgi:HEAT repeat protein